MSSRILALVRRLRLPGEGVNAGKGDGSAGGADGFEVARVEEEGLLALGESSQTCCSPTARAALACLCKIGSIWSGATGNSGSGGIVEVDSSASSSESDDANSSPRSSSAELKGDRAGLRSILSVQPTSSCMRV